MRAAFRLWRNAVEDFHMKSWRIASIEQRRLAHRSDSRVNHVKTRWVRLDVLPSIDSTLETSGARIMNVDNRRHSYGDRPLPSSCFVLFHCNGRGSPLRGAIGSAVKIGFVQWLHEIVNEKSNASINRRYARNACPVRVSAIHGISGSASAE